jgi:hypothetical protein
MSATAAAALVVVMMMLVIATLVATTLVVATTSAATAASASHVLDKMLDLLLGSLAVLDDLTLEVECLASQRVIGINGNAVFLDLNDLGHELVVLIVHQSDNGTLENIIVVEVAIYGEYLAANLMYTLGYILAESLCRSEFEIKVATLLQILYFLLECIESYAESGDKLEWTIIASLLFKLALTILKAV